VEAETVNFRQLKIEARNLMESCFWANGNYWSTRNPKLKKDRAKTRIKVAYLSRTGWFGFIFSKFSHGVIEIFRSSEKREMWFYQEPVNQYLSFSVWCVNAKHFESVLEQLRVLPEIELEFVVTQTKQGLRIPPPFEVMGLQFYEVNPPCQKKTSGSQISRP